MFRLSGSHVQAIWTYSSSDSPKMTSWKSKHVAIFFMFMVPYILVKYMLDWKSN
jgi:hypothetical protein